MNKPIGGYFEWEFPSLGQFNLHDDAVLLNSCRHALEYIIRGIGNISRIYIPYYTCDAVLQPIERLNVPFSFYSLDNQLEIDDDITLDENEYLLYTNYFGIKDSYARDLANKYGEHIIIDNAQALYCPAFASHQIYSPRKFLGMPDGGIAITNVDDYSEVLPQGISYDRCKHLLKRIELVPSSGYNDFKDVSCQIASSELSKMSVISKNILLSVDLNDVKNRRLNNFNLLHGALKSSNKLGALLTNSLHDSCTCPMVYPYWTSDNELKSRLIKEQVFVATYWSNVLEWTQPGMIEYEFANNLLAIPCDQRYGEDDMNKIIELICK